MGEPGRSRPDPAEPPGGARRARTERAEATVGITSPTMALADLRKEFIAVQAARAISARKLFEERAPGVLRAAVLGALAEEAEKERTLDEEARRMMEAARQEIASGRVDGQELFRRIRRKLAEQRGIVL